MEPAASAFRSPTENDVHEAVARLRRALDPLRIDVFGSVGRGDATAGSDLDLLVVFDGLDRAEKRETAARARSAVGRLGVGVDIVVTSPAEIERRGWVVGTVLREALQTGRTVYRRDAS